jgi:DnaJ-class molecular chaperone
MKKLSNSSDNINSNIRISSRGGFSGADFGEGEDFSDFFQNMFGGAGGALAKVQEEELPENSRDRIYRQN